MRDVGGVFGVDRWHPKRYSGYGRDGGSELKEGANEASNLSFQRLSSHITVCISSPSLSRHTAKNSDTILVQRSVPATQNKFDSLVKHEHNGKGNLRGFGDRAE